MIENAGWRDFDNGEIVIEYTEATIAHIWCPYCGGWHGASPPPAISTTGEAEAAPKIPESIGKIVRQAMEEETNVTWKPLAEQWEDSGLIDGKPAIIKREGDRLRAIWSNTPDPDPYNHREIITNDGVNAAYVRDLDERVVVNENRDDPYEPYTRDTSNRYTFE